LGSSSATVKKRAAKPTQVLSNDKDPVGSFSRAPNQENSPSSSTRVAALLGPNVTGLSLLAPRRSTGSLSPAGGRNSSLPVMGLSPLQAASPSFTPTVGADTPPLAADPSTSAVSVGQPTIGAKAPCSPRYAAAATRAIL